MARKLRMEYGGAVYHVINRGNYRKWVFEEEGAKAAFEACLFEAKETRVWKSDGARAVRRENWASILGELLALIPAEAQTDARKSAPWKVAVATRMKALTQVPNGWLAERLGMGSPIYVSKHVGLLRRNGGPAGRWLERFEKVNSKA